MYALNIQISIVYTFVKYLIPSLFSFLYSFISNYKFLSIIALCFAFPKLPLASVTTSSSLEQRAVVAVFLTVVSQGSTSSSAGVYRHRGHHKTNNQQNNQQFGLTRRETKKDHMLKICQWRVRFLLSFWIFLIKDIWWNNLASM